MVHGADTLARFLDGETRLIFARRVDDGELVEMPQGEAAEWRQRTRTGLRCPVPDCTNPQLKVVARAPRRRDGFSHLAGAGGHAAESLFHLQGKARIAAWLRKRHPELTVVIEQPSNQQRERVADVMATSPQGQRWAFEIQYAPLTLAQWQQRSASYRAQGIVDVWLFGHAGKQLRYRDTTGRATLTHTQQGIRAANRRVLWLNPLTAEIATAVTQRSADGQTFDVLATTEGRLAIEALADVELTPRGLDSPVLRRLAAGAAEYEAARALAAERAAAERAAWEADRPRREAEQREAATQEAARRRRQHQQQLEQLTAEWHAAPEFAEIVRRFPAGAPWWLARADRVNSGFFPVAWHAILFLRYIDTLPAGTVLHLHDALGAFLEHVTPSLSSARSGLTESIRDWLYALADAGWLERADLADPKTAFAAMGEPAQPWAPPAIRGGAGRQIPASICATCGKPLDRREAHHGARNHRSCMNRWRVRDPRWRY